MPSDLSDFLDESTPFLKETNKTIDNIRKFAESSTRSPLTFNKGAIFIVFLIIFLIICIRWSFFPMTFYEMLFITILFIILLFAISYLNIKIDWKPTEKKENLLKKLEIRDALTHKYPNPQLDILIIKE